jgi:hypothetical protein
MGLVARGVVTPKVIIPWGRKCMTGVYLQSNNKERYIFACA